MKTSSLLVAVLAISVLGCSSAPKKEEGETRDPDRPSVFNDRQDPLSQRRREAQDARLSAEQLYRRARADLDSSDFAGAIENYDALSTRFPFSDFATQGELERIYALYRNYEMDRALSAADRFLREHPRHAQIDYIHYLKGLINFNRDESALNLMSIDESKSDVSSLRRAFDDFSLLIQKFPGSRYNGDAYQRMVFIRNRLAEHELHVVDFYLRRGAYVAAAKRGEQIIAQYPGTPASRRALRILVECYERAGLEQQAQDARALLAAQGAENDDAPAVVSTVSEAAAPEPRKPGVMARIAGWFSPLDREGTEVVIPTGASKPAPAAAPAASQTAGTPPADTAPAASDSAEKKPGRRIDVFFEPYDPPAPAPAP